MGNAHLELSGWRWDYLEARFGNGILQVVNVREGLPSVQACRGSQARLREQSRPVFRKKTSGWWWGGSQGLIHQHLSVQKALIQRWRQVGSDLYILPERKGIDGTYPPGMSGGCGPLEGINDMKDIKKKVQLQLGEVGLGGARPGSHTRWTRPNGTV